MSPVVNWLCSAVRQMQSDIIAIKKRCEEIHVAQAPDAGAVHEQVRQVVSIADALSLSVGESLLSGGKNLFKKSSRSQQHHEDLQEVPVSDDLLFERLEVACTACEQVVANLGVELIYMDLMRVMSFAVPDVHLLAKDHAKTIDQSAIHQPMEEFILSLSTPGISELDTDHAEPYIALVPAIDLQSPLTSRSTFRVAHHNIVATIKRRRMFHRLFRGHAYGLTAISRLTCTALVAQWEQRCKCVGQESRQSFDDLIASHVYDQAMAASIDMMQDALF